MSRERRQQAEFLAREVARLMDMGVPKHVPFDSWLADYFMRFAHEVERERSPRLAAPTSPTALLSRPGEPEADITEGVARDTAELEQARAKLAEALMRWSLRDYEGAWDFVTHHTSWKTWAEVRDAFRAASPPGGATMLGEPITDQERRRISKDGP